MTIEQMRLALVAVLMVVVGFGIYVGWHFTHQTTPCKTGSTSSTGWAGCRK